CCPGYANPPRLNVTEEYAIDTRTTNTLSIRCEGVRPLHWNWTTSLEPDDPILNITYDKHPNTDYPYVSTLTIMEPFIVDTGFYYCYYEEATNFVTDRQNVDSTYAYIF
ncbi:hypothetical protein SK128_024461, partial [Halocaridina rubra]